MRLINDIKLKTIKNPGTDIIGGIIIALVSLPIALGYAQIAGLPIIYGLYGSIFPIIVFGIMTTSPQIAVGVDAMPAAMVGALLSELMINPETDEAINLIAIVALLVALWFVVFYFVQAGRIVKYISTPVLGGFISGVGITIILMQIPKLFGGSSGTGVLYDLTINIFEQFKYFNLLSATLGIGTIIVILVCKRYIPKVPMTVIMMGVGAMLQLVFRLDNYGVKHLAEVSAELPRLFIPMLEVIKGHTINLLVKSFSIAAVIMAQTLLASGSYAQKYGYKIDAGKELLAYAGMNAVSGFIGCCPINGSVSRSGMADSLKVKSQLMSITAGFTMLLILLFATPLIKYLPVPVLTGIVMTALIGIIDFKLFKRLWKISKSEWVVFMLSMIAVLVLGTVNGVIVGCLLSFWEVAVRAVQPPTCFVGRIPGHGNFHSLERNSHARPIKNAIIYRFSGNLFFANIDRFEREILDAIKEDTKVVIVDARGIGSVDITAVDRLVSFEKELERKGIRFYVTEHESSLNDQIKKLGGEYLLNEGKIRRTITLALRDAGIDKPYILEDTDRALGEPYMESEEKLAEFEWAFGDEAEERLQRLAESTAVEIAEHITEHDEHIAVLENHGATTKWGMLGLFDEHEFWDFLENKLEEMLEDGKLNDEDVNWIEERIELRRHLGEKRLSELNPRALKILSKHKEQIQSYIKSKKNTQE